MPELEKNVPLPVGIASGRKDPLYEDFSKMEIGDSYLYNTIENGKAVQSSATQYKQKNKKTWNYTSRSQPGGKIRIWRTAVSKYHSKLIEDN